MLRSFSLVVLAFAGCSSGTLPQNDTNSGPSVIGAGEGRGVSPSAEAVVNLAPGAPDDVVDAAADAIVDAGVEDANDNVDGGTDDAVHCETGFTERDGECVDFDECVTQTHDCESDDLCVNIMGSFVCTGCPATFDVTALQERVYEYPDFIVSMKDEQRYIPIKTTANAEYAALVSDIETTLNRHLSRIDFQDTSDYPSLDHYVADVFERISKYVVDHIDYGVTPIAQWNQFFEDEYGFDCTSDEARAFYWDRYNVPMPDQAFFVMSPRQRLDYGHGKCFSFGHSKMGLLVHKLFVADRICGYEVKMVGYHFERHSGAHAAVAVESEDYLVIGDATSPHIRSMGGGDKEAVVWSSLFDNGKGERRPIKLTAVRGVSQDRYVHIGEMGGRIEDAVEVYPFDLESNPE